ncbi:MAG: MbcA/ParS/Xre antitoxin family protein [Nitrospiraceae bacterium]|nr:MbcA/ParS/Xre antitoxin family protein [Nitrospiraceae bacterium]
MSGLVLKDNKVTTEVRRSRESRVALAKMIMKLFDLWKLSTQDQMALLGLSEGSRMSLTRYRKGEPLADSRDLMDRVAALLSIHQSLRILFPQNRELAYKWPITPNRAFNDQSPVELIRKEGFLGLLTVKRRLDFERGR